MGKDSINGLKMIRYSAMMVAWVGDKDLACEQLAIVVHFWDDLGHGSTVNPDSSAPTWTHAREIQRRNVFADVQCAFWKEEPSLRDARFFFPDETIHEVFVVPNFISEGYFTQTVIPRELELEGPI